MKSIEPLAQKKSEKAVAAWLFTTAGFVFAMIIIGAITRLTESGLSMVEWRPLIGALPPLSEAEWSRVFAIYQQTPEFQKINSWMELGDFKKIFFWEWFHRFWGRLIGIVYALPLIYFWITKQIRREDRPAFTGLLFLGGAQAVMGWYMVASGLVDVPAVSHYRLAAHLSLALVIISLLVLMGLRYRGFYRDPHKGLYIQGWATLGLLAITIFWGAYVAGLDAGKIYNEWPLMGGSFFPPDMWFMQPAWINIFEHHPAVQFTHRWLAIVTMIAVLAYVWRAIKAGSCPFLFGTLGTIVVAQVVLGIITLLSNVWIPPAVLHQAGGAILLCYMVASIYHVRPDRVSPEKAT